MKSKIYCIRKWTITTICFLVYSLIFHSCTSDSDKKIPPIFNRDGSVQEQYRVPVTIRRFEQDLFALDTLKIYAPLSDLKKSYREFASIFFQQILNDGLPYDSIRQGQYVSGFIRNAYVRKLYDTTQILYRNFQPYQKEFEKAFALYHFYFPQKPIPEITTFISEYGIANFIYGKDQLACGLDFFLGDRWPYDYYNAGNPNFSQYLVRTYNRDHLVAKTLRPLIEDISGQVPGNRFQDYIIQEGKKWYLLDALLPQVSDTVKAEWTLKQWDWCQKNERNIWLHFITNKLLQSSDYKKFQKHITYSPNAPGMPAEAPGRTGAWIGWKIVKRYMEKYPKLTIPQLLAEKDHLKILTESGYKPPR